MLPQDRRDASSRERRKRRAAQRHLWLERYRNGIALYAGCRSQAPHAGSDDESCSRERNYNIYSLTWAGGEGRRAEIKVKSKAKNFSGAVERTRRSISKSPANSSVDIGASIWVLYFVLFPIKTPHPPTSKMGLKPDAAAPVRAFSHQPFACNAFRKMPVNP